MQRALIQYRRPENYDLVKEALIKAGRQDLIGFDKNKCLIAPRKFADGSKKSTNNKSTAGNKNVSNSNNKSGNKNVSNSKKAAVNNRAKVTGSKKKKR